MCHSCNVMSTTSYTFKSDRLRGRNAGIAGMTGAAGWLEAVSGDNGSYRICFLRFRVIFGKNITLPERGYYSTWAWFFAFLRGVFCAIPGNITFFTATNRCNLNIRNSFPNFHVHFRRRPVSWTVIPLSRTVSRRFSHFSPFQFG